MFSEVYKRDSTTTRALLNLVEALSETVIHAAETNTMVRQCGLQLQAHLHASSLCHPSRWCARRCMSPCAALSLWIPFLHGLPVPMIVPVSSLGEVVVSFGSSVVLPTFPLSVWPERARCCIGGIPSRAWIVMPVPPSNVFPLLPTPSGAAGLLDCPMGLEVLWIMFLVRPPSLTCPGPTLVHCIPHAFFGGSLITCYF